MSEKSNVDKVEGEGEVKGTLTCTGCNQNYKYKLSGLVQGEEIPLNSSMTVGDFLKNAELNILKMISHGDTQQLQCGNCHSLLDLSNLDHEEGMFTHDCKINCHYTKLMIIGCDPNCTSY